MPSSKTLSLSPQDPEINPEIDLQQLVGQLMLTFNACACRKNSQMVNNIREQMAVHTDKLMLACVIGNLLYNTIVRTENDFIEVSAKSFSHVTLIHIRKSENLFEEDIAKSFMPVKALAERLGGCISVSSHRTKGTTVAFTFLNTPQAAA